jgi:peptidoglycan/xylan/chitin deacetylase (PgdA/CDA1 family)
MMRLLLALLACLAAAPALADDLLEPTLHIAKGGKNHPQVALTLDACGGGTDLRILDTLINNQIPATIFVTRKWILNNPGELATMATHPDLFELEDHGADHIPAVLGSEKVYGIAPAGTIDAVKAEVQGGADALWNQAKVHSHWYRGATAKYSPASLDLIKNMGLGVAGYSLNADYGASVFAPAARKQVISAQDGDVIIAHINQPKRHSGEGVSEGILALKAEGFRFVRLEDVQEIGGDGRG